MPPVNGFLGRYENQMDEKGRVSLPAAFRKEADGDRFVLLQWEPPYLTLFPAEAWAGVRQRLIEYRRSGPGGWAQIRRITSQATEVGPDKQGRILVPAWLQEAADLKGSVMVIGALDRIEIWNPSALVKAESGREDDFSELAPKIFG